MPIEITMPALGPTMEEGGVARWLVAPEARVTAGQPLAEIETDKAVVELEAPADGVVTRILVGEGAQNVRVGTVLAQLGPAAADSPVVAPPPVPAIAPERSFEPLRERIRATPLARRLAAQHGIDLARMRGSGPAARIVRADLELALRQLPLGGIEPAAAAETGGQVWEERAKPHTARRFQLVADCDLRAAAALLDMLNADPRARQRAVPVETLLVKALGLAARSSRGADSGARAAGVDVALLLSPRPGSTPPVMRGVDGMALFALSAAMEAARASRSAEPESAGPPHAAIAFVGRPGIRQFDAMSADAPCVLSIGSVRAQPAPGEDEPREMAAVTIVASFASEAYEFEAAADLLLAFTGLLQTPLAILA